MPPSTTSSNTTSAASSPACGRANCALSTLTTSTGRWSRLASAARIPVSGYVGGGGGTVTVAAGAVVWWARAATGRGVLEQQAARTSARSAAPATALRREGKRTVGRQLRRCGVGGAYHHERYVAGRL